MYGPALEARERAAMPGGACQRALGLRSRAGLTVLRHGQSSARAGAERRIPSEPADKEQESTRSEAATEPSARAVALPTSDQQQGAGCGLLEGGQASRGGLACLAGQAGREAPLAPLSALTLTRTGPNRSWWPAPAQVGTRTSEWFWDRANAARGGPPFSFVRGSAMPAEPGLANKTVESRDGARPDPSGQCALCTTPQGVARVVAEQRQRFENG